MFNKLMNNYYFGKSGKGDYTPDDLPTNRWQLFLDTLRTRFSALIRLNLMYVVVWLPTLVVITLLLMGALNVFNQMDLGDGTSYQTRMVDDYNAEKAAASEADAATLAQQAEQGGFSEKQPVLTAQQARDNLMSLVFTTLLLLIPCIAITGPFTAGVAYVLQHWTRDEHAFIWSDFKDAVKENWKQGLLVSAITAVAPILVYMSWTFYGAMAETNVLMMVPQLLVLMLGIVWAISVTYMYPLMVSYQLSVKDLLRNGVMLGIARLPMSVGIRLLHCLPVVLGLLAVVFINTQYSLMILGAYYLLLGFALSRFVTASYTNAVFDRFINAHIAGAPVNRGLREEEKDELDDGEE